MAKVTTTPRLTPAASLSDVAAHPLLDELTGTELVIYLRLLAAAGEAGSRKIEPLNASLYRGDAKIAAKALRSLDTRKLITIEYDNTKRPGRSITVR